MNNIVGHRTVNVFCFKNFKNPIIVSVIALAITETVIIQEHLLYPRESGNTLFEVTKLSVLFVVA